MADLQKTVEIVFGGRNDLSQAVGEVERSLSRVSSASQPFADMADNVLKAEAAVVGLGLAVAGLSIARAGEFADGFAEITTLIDGNVDSLGGYRQEILDYATDSTQSLSQINGAVYAAISAGADYADSLDVVSSAERLAVAGKGELDSTLVALVSTLNAYGASTAEAGDYADIFFTTVKQGQTTIPELSQSLAQVTSIAASAGLPFDQLSAAIAALTATGMPTSQAITSIKAALTNIIKPSSEARDAASDLGIEFGTTALKTQGLGGFMQSLQQATGGNVDTMGRLFGSSEALAGVLTLAADSSGRFAGSLDAMENRAGATAEAYDKMADNFGLTNQRLINNLDVVLVGTGTRLLDEYGEVIAGLIANLQGIGTAIDAGSLDGLVGIFESAMTDIAKLLEGVAKVLPQALAGIDWAPLAASFDNLQGSVGDLFATLFDGADLTTADGLKDALQTITDLIAGLTNVSAGVVDGLKPLFVVLRELAEGFKDADSKSQEFIGNILGLGKSVNVIAGSLEGITSAAGGAANALMLIGGSSVINAIRGLITSLGIGGLGGALSGLVSGTGNLLAALGAGGLGATLATAGAAVAGVGVAIGATALSFESMVEAQTEAFEAEKRAETSAILLAQKYETIAEKTGVVITSTKDLRDALEDGRLKVSHFSGELVNAAQYSEEFEQNVSQMAAASWKFEDTFDGMNQALREMGIELEGTGEKVQQTEQYFDNFGNALEGFDTSGTRGTFSVVSDGAREVTDELDKAAAASEKFKTEMEKLSSDERIRAMELAVDFNIAALEADSKQAIAIIDGIGTAIESTGETLVGLGGLLGEASNFSDKWLIEDAFEQEMELRREAIDMQKEMTTAQAEYLREKTRLLASGDGLVTIDSNGLEPALEMIMWEIIKKVQIKVNEESSALLLGM